MTALAVLLEGRIRVHHEVRGTFPGWVEDLTPSGMDELRVHLLDVLAELRGDNHG